MLLPEQICGQYFKRRVVIDGKLIVKNFNPKIAHSILCKSRGVQLNYMMCPILSYIHKQKTVLHSSLFSRTETQNQFWCLQAVKACLCYGYLGKWNAVLKWSWSKRLQISLSFLSLSQALECFYFLEFLGPEKL